MEGNDITKEVVTNYRMPLVNLYSYNFFSNPSEEWE